MQKSRNMPGERLRIADKQNSGQMTIGRDLRLGQIGRSFPPPGRHQHLNHHLAGIVLSVNTESYAHTFVAHHLGILNASHSSWHR